MPTVDVFDLQQSDSRLARSGRRGVRRRSQRRPDLRSGAALSGWRNASGTAKTKTRQEVSGSGKKLWKQKGTGRARMGSIRSPLWRHGGTIHGPVPRDLQPTSCRARCCSARCARLCRRSCATAS